MEFCQDHMDDFFIRNGHDWLGGEGFWVKFPLDPQKTEALVNLCISDAHKSLLLNVKGLTRHLVAGLFLDPDDHPRGLNAVPPATPTPLEVQAIFQRNFSETIQQLSLFEPGKEVLLQDDSIVEAMEAVAEGGMSEEARESARGALMALVGPTAEPKKLEGEEHVMLSCAFSPHSEDLTALRTRS